MANALPGCFSEYPNAVGPNKCGDCRYRESCKRYVKREDVLQVFKDILEICERALGGRG